MEPLNQFSWPRATGRSYVWQTLRPTEGFETPKKKARMITFPAPMGSTAGEMIQPQNISDALLWRLADTEVTESGIQKFAEAYGLLTGSQWGVPLKGGPAYQGEEISVWRNAIQTARQATQLRTAATNGDSKFLGKHIRWNNKTGAVQFEWKDGFGERKARIAAPDDRPNILAIFEPGDLVMPAKFMAARITNEQLNDLARPQLAWSQQLQRHSIYLVPINLLGMMWLQFAQSIDRDKEVGSCEVCGEWFQRTRSDKRVCSDRCRVRAMRIRKGLKK